MEQELDLGVALVAGQLGQAVEEGDGIEGSWRGVGHGDLRYVFAEGNTHFSSLREGPWPPLLALLVMCPPTSPSTAPSTPQAQGAARWRAILLHCRAARAIQP
ncbi:hypothetical protein AMYX_19220 [Anaeromyxobacter diazotrophicus]|uniref:Uncharacterized protein n=1 Tax=Anaeromyxobacter diazotrophicus TaxID=2590199 RepID=A0A7I9VLA8_9BACT|nr:hypothetical protein AMYX_19220 [Anaeromyxobacter diazotrophicus]